MSNDAFEKRETRYNLLENSDTSGSIEYSDYTGIATNAALELDLSIQRKSAPIEQLIPLINNFTKTLKKYKNFSDITFARIVIKNYSGKTFQRGATNYEVVQEFESTITSPLESLVKENETDAKKLKKLCLSLARSRYPAISDYSPTSAMVA